MSKTRAPAAGRARRPRPGSSSRAAAVGFFALLPIAVAIGVVVGRSGSDSGENEALLEALRNQNAGRGQHRRRNRRAPRRNSAKANKAKAAAKAATRATARSLAKTSNGDRPRSDRLQADAAKKIEEDTQAGRRKPRTDRRNYIKAQQNLPDVIVVGGDPSEAPAAPDGAGEP